MANFKFNLLRSNGVDYDTLYPKTIWSQIEPNTIPSTFPPTAHSHGNIVGAGGTITSALVTPATNDCILISDASNSGKVERGITINTTHGNAFLRKDGSWAIPPDNNSGGTVTSVGGTGTVSGITLSGTVTSTGSLKLGGTLSVAASNFSSQTAKTFLAAPVAAAGVPTFRAITASDIPTLNQNTTGNAATATKLESILTTFTGSYPLTVNVSGKIYSHSNMTFTGSTGVLAAPVFAEGGTSLTDKYAAKTHTHSYEPVITAGTTSQYYRGDKTWQTFPTILALGETSSTAYPGDKGKTAYNHSQVAHAPSGAQVNVLEGVQVAGANLTVSSKKVNIPYAGASTPGVVRISISGTTMNIYTTA